MTRALQVTPARRIWGTKRRAQSAKPFARRIRTRCSLLLVVNWCWSDA